MNDYTPVVVLISVLLVIEAINLVSRFLYQRANLPEQPIPEVGQVWYPAWYNIFGRRVRITEKEVSPVDGTPMRFHAITDYNEVRLLDLSVSGYVWWGDRG